MKTNLKLELFILHKCGLRLAKKLANRLKIQDRDFFVVVPFPSVKDPNKLLADKLKMTNMSHCFARGFCGEK